MKSACALLAATALAACASSGGKIIDRIDAAFGKLGATPARSRCFAESLAANDAAKDAAALVEAARDKEDMRARVLGADDKTRRAFIAANLACAGVR